MAIDSRKNGLPELSIRKRVLFVAIMFAVSFLLLEAGLRLTIAMKMGPRILLYGTSFYQHRAAEATAWATDSALQTNEATYAKYRPRDRKFDFDHETGEKFPVTINAQGFRGRDFSFEKQRGTIRIVTLGASSTFGYYNRDHQTYPYQLEQLLKERTGGRPAFEVINLGIPHLTSKQILSVLRAEALPLQPDIVTFYEGINDASQMPEEVWKQKLEEVSQNVTSKVRAGLADFGRVRALYREARERLLVISLFDSEVLGAAIRYSKADYEHHVAGKVDEFISNVEAMREACRERGIIFIVLKQQARSMMVGDVKGVSYEQEIQMVRTRLDETNSITHFEKAFLTHKLLIDSLEAWARSKGVPFVDVTELLDGDRDVLLTWVHLSPRGNRMIAEALANEILLDLRLGGTPGPPSGM